jgi:phosphoenolpyruvate-protein phosphotransferase (PTS system enzyme I)
LRGVRLSLARRALFEAQLRAILRASGYGSVRILVPMVTRREEMVSVRALVKSLARDLRSEGHEIGENFDIGAMIEVPAAALALSGLRDQVDFVSIGTNDLMQYMLAADRDNEALSDLYSPLHPAFLRVLHEVIALGIRRRLPVAICGEMAGDIRFTRLLLALGLTDFSLHPTTLLEVRQVIRNSDLGELRARVRTLLRARDREGIERWLSS